MKITKGLTSTGNIVAETPKYLFDRISSIFNFSLDVCALPENAKCESYYTPDDDGLSKPWRGGVWCNPPYGREISSWVKKAYEESQKEYNSFVFNASSCKNRYKMVVGICAGQSDALLHQGKSEVWRS